MNLTNWRTTLFGSVFLAAAFISQNPGMLDAVVDPALAQKIASVAALISGFMAFANAKDKQVAGNGTMDAPHQVDQGNGTSKTILPTIPLSLIAAGLLFPCALLLGGCVATKAWFADPGNQAKLKATGSWLVGKAEQIAINTVVSAAQSQADAGVKADWMDSLATGLRTNAVADFGSEDVKTLIGIWTPDKPHWQELGGELADLAKQAATLPAGQRNEALAQALNQAAQLLRAQAAAPTQVWNRKPNSIPDALPTLYSASGEQIAPVHFLSPTVILREP